MTEGTSQSNHRAQPRQKMPFPHLTPMVFYLALQGHIGSALQPTDHYKSVS